MRPKVLFGGQYSDDDAIGWEKWSQEATYTANTNEKDIAEA